MQENYTRPMPFRKTLQIEVLHRILRFDADTGKLYWRLRSDDLFRETPGRSASHACANWNSRYAGKEAFTSISNFGYRQGMIFGVIYLAHRIIFAIHYGYWSGEDIDHANGDQLDNTPKNLREATHSENCKNVAAKVGSSGVRGAYLQPSGKYQAKICKDGKQIHLGYFEKASDAGDAYNKAAEQLHGNFAFKNRGNRT